MALHKSRLLFTLLAAAFLPAPALAGPISNTASYSFEDPDRQTITGTTNQLKQEIVDPFGKIQGCGGEELASYSGFMVGLFDAGESDLPTSLTPLPPTGPGTAFAGLTPNIGNVNPFALGVTDPKGGYNFFLNKTAGQLNVGRRYILSINPPIGSRQFAQRQIRLVITDRNEIANTISYQATALDGRGISLDGSPDSFTTTVSVRDAANAGLVLSTLSLLDRPICIGPAQPLQITKTADRAAAQPGDTIIYRLSIRNNLSVGAKRFEVSDRLPLGFRFVKDSARGELAGVMVPIESIDRGSDLTLKFAGEVPPDGVLSVAYAVQLSPDALRGNGENLASVTGRRADTDALLRDGPARAKVRVNAGLLSDCGLILGRVFEDKNFDGEQQPGEPGLANAVVMLDDGTKVTTDRNGLYSIANVQSGHRSGVLDLTSVPGYDLAPNRITKERSGRSRLVQLAPGSMVRMNFAVTPWQPIGQAVQGAKR
jgi:uncharacterized repeat protein (TIGR01451 family)